MGFVRRFDGSTVRRFRLITVVPTARQNMRLQTHKQTDRQTDICLQNIYVEGPVQNNEKTKIENVVSIILDGPLQG